MPDADCLAGRLRGPRCCQGSHHGHGGHPGLPGQPTLRHGPTVRSIRSPTSCSSLARVRFSDRCFGPLASAVMNGRLTSVLWRRAELDLGLLGRLLEPLQRHAVLAQVDALVLLELVDDPVDDALVEVVAAQERVAVGGLDFEDALADSQDRDVEGAAAQVVDGDGLVLAALVEPVGQRRGRGLVDDAQDFETGDACRRPWWPGAGCR